jgi:hypothetical protein
VFLLPFSSFRVTVSEDEVDFVCRTTLVWSKHDSEGSLNDCQLRIAFGNTSAVHTLSV